jgi:hypothetical protein
VILITDTDSIKKTRTMTWNLSHIKFFVLNEIKISVREER